MPMLVPVRAGGNLRCILPHAVHHEQGRKYRRCPSLLVERGELRHADKTDCEAAPILKLSKNLTP